MPVIDYDGTYATIVPRSYANRSRSVPRNRGGHPSTLAPLKGSRQNNVRVVEPLRRNELLDPLSHYRISDRREGDQLSKRVWEERALYEYDQPPSITEMGAIIREIRPVAARHLEEETRTNPQFKNKNTLLMVNGISVGSTMAVSTNMRPAKTAERRTNEARREMERYRYLARPLATEMARREAQRYDGYPDQNSGNQCGEWGAQDTHLRRLRRRSLVSANDAELRDIFRKGRSISVSYGAGRKPEAQKAMQACEARLGGDRPGYGCGDTLDYYGIEDGIVAISRVPPQVRYLYEDYDDKDYEYNRRSAR